MRVNLIRNPSFEVDDLGGWTNVNGYTWRHGAGRFGSWSRVIQGWDWGRARLECGVDGLVPGRTYTVSAYFQVVNTLGTDHELNVQFYDNDTNWTYLGEAGSEPLRAATGSEWVRRHVTFTMPPGAGHAQVYAPMARGISYTSTTSDEVRVDGVLLEEGGLQPYFDGDTAGYKWDGAPHASTSSAVVHVPPPPVDPGDRADPARHMRIEVETSPGTWFDITGPSKSVSIGRADSDPGTMTAEVLDANLDPRNNGLLRRGKAARVQVNTGAGAGWQSIYTGTLDNVEADETPEAPEGKRVNVRVTALDNVATLANTPEDRGVGTINDLRWLVGDRVPFVINGQTTPLSSGTVVARNENASLWDQVLVTRDSNLGYAWVDADNRLRVAGSLDAVERASFTPSVYREVDFDFGPEQIINSVVVNWRRYNVGTETATDVPYGPYRDEASVGEWGERQVTFTVQGATEVEADIAAFAQDVLDRNSEAEHLPRSVTVPIRSKSQLAMLRAVDLNSRVSVTHPDGLKVDGMRVVGISHDITPSGWRVTYALAKPLALTAPSQTPGTGLSPIPPGSIGEDELSGGVKDALQEAYDKADAAAAAADAAASTATTALSAANGKNKTWFATHGPGSTANTAGDIWFQKDAATQAIIGQWEGQGGFAWAQRQIRNEVIANLDAGKLIAGSAITNALSVKTNLTLGDASTNGVIQSHNFAGSSQGIYIDKFGFVAKGGEINGATINGGTVTGATFQTATAGSRVQIQGGGLGGFIDLYDGNTNDVSDLPGRIRTIGIGSPTSGGSSLTLESPRVTGTTKRAHIGLWAERTSGVNKSFVEVRADEVVLPNLPVRMAAGTYPMYVGTGTTTVYQNITFPSGRFTKPPVVTVTQMAGNANFYQAAGNSVTATGFTLNASKNGPSGQDQIIVHWMAVQMD